MHRRALLSFTALAVLAGCASTREGPMPAPVLTGSWAPVSAELSGKPYELRNFHGAWLTISADGKYEFDRDQGTVTVQPGVAPPYQMDIRGVQGPNAGRYIPAIYVMENEQLTIVYQLARDGGRPLSFESPPGSQILLIRYKRIVPAKA